MLSLLLLLIFLRPFIASLAFPYLNLAYNYLLIGSLLAWFLLKKPPLACAKKISYPLILFISVLIISLSSSHRTAGFRELTVLYIEGALLLLFAATLNAEVKEQILRCLTASAVCIGLLAIYQYFFGFQHVLNYVTKEKITDEFVLEYLKRGRAFLPFVTPRLVSVVLPLILYPR